MDRLQYVYSSSETSDEELESADTALSPKESSTTIPGPSKKAADIFDYTPARHHSQSPSETRSSSEKRHSPESVKGRSRSRGRSSESRKDRRSPSYHRSKERRRSRDKGHDRDRDRGRSDRKRHKSRERSRDRSKDRRRDRSRERRYDRRSSRSPRRSHRESPRRSKDRSRSPPPRKHFDPKNKLYILNRMGIDYKGTEIVDFPNRQPAGGTSSNAANASVPQYYNPLTINAGKYAEQIAKRKMLWNSKKAEKPEATAGNIWQGAKFSQDSDGKVAAKFQRLMGMKDGVAEPGSGPGQELIKKQEELFSTMEMQYEVARATTHTQRGVGLGFGPRHIP